MLNNTTSFNIITLDVYFLETLLVLALFCVEISQRQNQLLIPGFEPGTFGTRVIPLTRLYGMYST